MYDLKKCVACGNASPREIRFPDGIVRICAVCGNQWAEMLTGSTETVRYNYYMDPRSYGNPARYPPFLELFRFLDGRFGRRGLKILDVGCGAGVFLEECLRRGHDPVGIEADSRLKTRMASTLRDRIHFDFVERITDLPRDFDLICFWDSFEHLRDPFALLDRLKTHLKPNGIFFIRVNNNFDVYNLLSGMLLKLAPPLGRRLLYECFGLPFHHWNFSREGLMQVLKTYKFEVLRYTVSETPAFRLSPNPLVISFFKLAYAVNRAIGGGKIANVFLRPDQSYGSLPLAF